ncbi:MAG: DNA repair protein [Betaproteobacteria bacterium HGW-Betaproteobacteria-5]|jgi:exonuclease SbcC|nr:MAG: DNA repair protein [Betaproteobacteria bacterium HGW-Betaproteobacteria-5]
MYPLSLTLKGFRGIRDGLGRAVLTLDLVRLAGDAQLVALAGANGRGKTTILDNLHPYLTMPSRATVAGAGGFSFYDQVYLAEAEKDLVWSHAGLCYRSQVVIRSNGRRATEAYLFARDESGQWRPLQLPDGTISDGKTGTYTQCVEHLLGSAETFFTSAFAAQGKRQLSAYQAGEIKTLLADLLGQEDIRTEGRKAGQVADLLKAGLVAIRREEAGLDTQWQRVNAERHRLADATGRVEAQARIQRERGLVLETARVGLVQQQTAFDHSRGTEVRRTQLSGERTELISVGKQAIEAITAQETSQRQCLDHLERRIATRKAQVAAQRQELVRQRLQCETALQSAAAVRRAGRRFPLAETLLAARTVRVQVTRERVSELHRCAMKREAARQRSRAIEREAGQAALRVEDLSRRFGLTREVPCAGSDLQGLCKLLGDAREAQTLMPDAQEVIRRLANEKSAAQRDLECLNAQWASLQDAPQELVWAEIRENRSRDRSASYARLSAREGEIRQARARLAEIDRELAALVPADGLADAETGEERAERRGIEAALQALATLHDQQAKHYLQMLDRLDASLAALPPAFDTGLLSDARSALASAQANAAQADRDHLQAVRDAEARAALNRQGEELKRQQETVAARIAKVESDLGSWNLLARCLSNDGLIALAIDDAGPTLAGFANDLLLACYGPRFTVSLLTQVETKKGEQRESFVIEVHDGESGQSKRVEQMSGGERTWINECLVRAVALYLAQHSGRCYGTLFSDEADGALDPARKRMFLAMKREVLRLGGYAREIFISQAPELTAMADMVIDLEVFAQSQVPDMV